MIHSNSLSIFNIDIILEVKLIYNFKVRKFVLGTYEYLLGTDGWTDHNKRKVAHLKRCERIFSKTQMWVKNAKLPLSLI